MPEFEPTIGIETHAQLLTISKMFCGCAAVSSSDLGMAPKGSRRNTTYTPAPIPNSSVCPVCLGMPGSLPVINRRAVEHVIMTGLALNCHINEYSRFDRKNYHYPDLVKGYQISQFHLPLCYDGWLDVALKGHSKRIGIHDIHLEEDTGKLVHIEGQSLIDFNRSGIPLMEIVTEPDFGSIEEVREYVVELRRILRYLGVNSGNMEEGAMRFEANVSLHPTDTITLGTRVEVKNLNSFRALVGAVEYEIARQTAALLSGETVHRETRGWDEATSSTYVQRSKELADDYRYFPEPDLPPLEIGREWVDAIRSRMPELPHERRQRFLVEYQLSPYDVGLLTDDRATADYFEQAARAAHGKGIAPKTVGNWITGELFHLLRTSDRDITSSTVTATQLADLLALLQEATINTTTAKRVLGVMFSTGKTAQAIVSERGLAKIADMDQLAAFVEDVIATNLDAVAQFKGGKETVLRFLVGQVMKATKGTADPTIAADLLLTRLTDSE